MTNYPSRFNTVRRLRQARTALGGILIGLLVIGGCTGFTSAYKGTERSVTAHVEGKERVCESTGDCKYLVFTDQGTFKLTDTLLYGRFNTSDSYGRIRLDTTYTFDVAGFRFGPLSLYPNIVSDLKAQEPEAGGS